MIFAWKHCSEIGGNKTFPRPLIVFPAQLPTAASRLMPAFVLLGHMCKELRAATKLRRRSGLVLPFHAKLLPECRRLYITPEVLSVTAFPAFKLSDLFFFCPANKYAERIVMHGESDL